MKPVTLCREIFREAVIRTHKAEEALLRANTELSKAERAAEEAQDMRTKCVAIEAAAFSALKLSIKNEKDPPNPLFEENDG